MINFTVGPVQMDDETLELGKEQIPYFRTGEFSALMKENESLLCALFDAPEGSRVVFMTGSGTASMEGGVMNFFTAEDKVLVVNGGGFGKRLVQLCRIHGVPFTEIALEAGKPLCQEHLAQFENAGYTGFLVQLCETSTGVRYDMEMIGDFCARNGIFLFVDAVSGFLADEFSMKRFHVNAAMTGSQKALALPPSMSFTVLDEAAVARAKAVNVASMYFNYPMYLLDGERGQTPFTPAVGTLVLLNDKLRRIVALGGAETFNRLSEERAAYFRKSISSLPLALFTAEKDSSNCVTALCPTTPNVSAHRVFELLKDEYGIWVCPNGGELCERVFRVGHLGAISTDEIDSLVRALSDLHGRGLL